MKLVWDSKSRTERGSGQYDRVRSDQHYHSPRWTKLSKRFRQAHPLCAMCQKEGRVAAAECVDHIIPWPICKDFYDESNLQSLCRRCNMLKGERDRASIQQYKREHQDRG